MTKPTTTHSRTRASKHIEFPSLLHWIFPAMVAVGAVTILFSGRVLSLNYEELAQTSENVRPIAEWLQRVVSVLIIAICVQRLVAWVAGGGRSGSPLLAGAFIMFWVGTVFSPAVFGAHPRLEHDYFYSLLIGTTAALGTREELHRSLVWVRTSLLLFLLASAALVFVRPWLVLDMNYSQGLLPGVPRFGGLAPHPVAMGIFSEIFLLCLWVSPFKRRSLNAVAWAVGLAALFFAQSKTSWVSFVLCAAAMFAVRNLPSVWRRMSDPKERDFGIVICSIGFLGVAALAGVLVFSNVEQKMAYFSSTEEGAQLMTLTGRDRIWEIAKEEWQAHPVFGYGPPLFDPVYRESIRMPNATSGHNQFYDTVARSGSVGATALVMYGLVLLAFALGTARATGGLGLALFIAIALRCFTEVPLLVYGYGMELFAHLLLIMTLASAVRRQPAAVVRPAPHASLGTPA
jgi:O-antigen ligase